jgi:diguanylate cyclase (GGDEF)-like protein
MVFTFPQLDVPTLALAVGILAAMQAAVSFTLARGSIFNELAFTHWGRSLVCGAGTFFLWSFAGHWPFFLTFLVANWFAIAAVPFGIGAYAHLFKTRPPTQLLWLTIVFGLSGVIGTYFFGTSRGIAIFTMNAGLTVQFTLMAEMVFRHRKKNSISMTVVSLLTIGLLATMHAVRAGTTVVGDFASVVPTGNSATQVVYYFAFSAYIAVSSVVFFAMNNEEIRRASLEHLRRDGLTGLLTRTAFFEMEQDIEATGRTDGYALMMIDIDHFKSVNDTFGHGGGDIVLTHLGRLISSSLRLSDIAVRYGGEEFCVVLRGCDDADAAQFAQRLVRESSMQKVRLTDERSTGFTLSVGYACVAVQTSREAKTESLKSVIDRADKALYRAKESGRNQAHASLMPNFAIVA